MSKRSLQQSDKVADKSDSEGSDIISWKSDQSEDGITEFDEISEPEDPEVDQTTSSITY